VLTPEEAGNIEVADFGLSDLGPTGLVLVTYVNTERVCAKELVLFPRQTCPEHRHPPCRGRARQGGTFRCRWGEVFLYVPASSGPGARPPAGLRSLHGVP
jgi:D-lyxose ketol-isomerase